ncbi:MAG TPA: ABC transporter permease [Candidatus Baltobacteraceae bacterium]|nr:ABC transporter permease [Candidatus Baltobacteraceae bacterium]
MIRTAFRSAGALGGPAGAILLAFALAAVAMLIAGVSPLDGFSALFLGSLGGRSQLAETLVQTTALLFPALGVCVAFRAGLFNIGAEGQLLIGGLAAGALGAHLNVPAPLAAIALFAAGIAGGGLWGALAGWLRAKFSASEIISTLMLNFIAFSVASYLVSGPLKASAASGAQTAPLAPGAWLPILVPGTRLSVALLVALACAVALLWTLNRTVFGYELRASGEAPEAARRNGVNMARMTVLALTLSGAIAGAGGAAIVGGVLHRFNTQLSPGYGYTAIAVALVGDLHPLWICAAAFGFGILESGGLAMQALADVPKDAIHVIEGLIVLVLAARRYIATRAEAVPL